MSNNLVVRKGTADIEFYSSADTARANKNILDLQNAIKAQLTKKTKDNYKVRFDKLAKHFSSIKTHSFVTLKNQLAGI